MNRMRTTLAALIVAVLMAAAGIQAAPGVKSVETQNSINGQVPDGPGNGFIGVFTDVVTTDGVATQSTGLNVAVTSCGFFFLQDVNAVVSINDRGTAASATATGVDPITSNTVSVSITAGSPGSAASRLSGTIRTVLGETLKVSISQDESAITTSTVVVKLNGTECFNGPYNPGTSSTFLTFTQKTTTS